MKNIKISNLILMVVSLVIITLYETFFYSSVFLTEDKASVIKIFLCWVGLIELILIFITWRIRTGKFITLYSIFMLFFFLFNYGQCFLWIFGIHSETEIGSMNLYYRLKIPSDIDIVRTQLIILISGFMIHVGAVYRSTVLKGIAVDEIDSRTVKKRLFDFSLLISPLVIFSEYYFQINNFINAKTYGYTGLYYNENVQSIHVIFQILSRLFFPALLGILIGSNYKNKKTIYTVYIIFMIDIFLSLIVGDRGGWLYKFLIMIMCHNTYYKKFKIKDLLLLGFSGYIVMVSLVAVKNIRNTGVTISKFLESFTASLLDPVSSTLTEMGGSMGITTALVMQGWDIFPYGNTFFWGLIISPSKRLINLFNLNYESVGSWFSQGYLNISNGAGFSIVAEVMINYGPYLLPFVMFIIGMLLYYITGIDNLCLENDTEKIFYKIITTSVVINISRNTFSYNLGEIIYTTVLFFILFEFYKLIVSSRGYEI